MLFIYILISLASCSKETEFGTHGKWQKYGQNEVGTFYFDNSSIVKTGLGEILVWDYLKLSQEHTREIGKAIPELLNVAHMLNHVKIDCQNNLYSQLRVIQYNREKKIVYDSKGKDMSPIANRPIPEDSTVEHLSKIVCGVKK